MHKYQLLVTIISLVLFGYFTSVILMYPNTRIEVFCDSKQIMINNITVNSWAEGKDIQIGDVVEKIDGKFSNNNLKTSSYCVIEKVKRISIRRNEIVKEYKVQYTPHDKQLIYHLLLPSVFYFTCLLIATYLFIRIPYMNKGSKDLLCFLHCLGIVFISIMAGLRKDLVAFIVASASLVYAFLFFIRFMEKVFKNEEIRFITERHLKWIHVISIVLVGLNIWIYTKHNKFVTDFIIISSSVLFSMIGYLLVRFYLKNKQSYYFKFIKIIMMSLVVSAIPFICLFLVPNIMKRKAIISIEAIGIFFLFIPICIFYMIIAGKLFDFKFVIHRLQYYILLSAGLTGFLVILGIVIFNNRGDNILDTVQFSLITFISLNLFLFIKDYLDFKLRKHLYHQQENYQFSLHRFLHQAKNEYKLTNLISIIKREISDVLKIEESCCVELNKREQLMRALDSEYISEDVLERLKQFQLETYTIGSIINLENYFGVVLSISTDRIIILLCKYNKRKNLNVYEIGWLETLCGYSDLLLECSNRVEDLVKQVEIINELEQPPTWLSKLLFHLSEKERTNLASDIHDGVLQDQIRLARKLETYRNESQDEEMKYILNEVHEEILDHIYTIRETCNNLRPPFLYELGLKKALLDLYKQANLKATFFFYYEIQDNIILPNVEYEQAIYRIIQELLNNAQKHSKASTVTIRLYEIGNHLYVTYIDDGIGIDLEKVKYSYGSLGLSGIVTRIQSLDGEISIDSKADNGLKMKIRIKIR